MVNLGYNHPVVMKMRLTKELEAAKKQVEEAKAERDRRRSRSWKRRRRMPKR